MDLSDIRDLAHQRELASRRISRSLALYEPENIDLDRLLAAIYMLDERAIRALLINEQRLDIEEVTFTKLREIGKSRCVKNYSRLTRLELINAIKEKDALSNNADSRG